MIISGLIAWWNVWPVDIEVVPEHLMHGHDTLKQRVACRTCECAMAAEIVGRRRERSVEGERDVRRLLEMGGKVWVEVLEAVVVVHVGRVCVHVVGGAVDDVVDDVGLWGYGQRVGSGHGRWRS